MKRMKRLKARKEWKVERKDVRTNQRKESDNEKKDGSSKEKKPVKEGEMEGRNEKGMWMKGSKAGK